MSAAAKTAIGFVVVTAISCGLAWNAHRKDPGSKQIDAIQSQVDSLAAEVSRLQALPDLPDIDGSWQVMSAIASACDARLTRGPGGEGIPAGPPGSWSGTLSATGVRAASCAEVIRRKVPAVFTGVGISEGEGDQPVVTLTFHLLGKGSQL